MLEKILLPFKRTYNWVGFMLFLVISCINNTASAQVLYNIPDTDISRKILNQIFGGLISGGGVDRFGSVISTFNTACLTVGGVLAAYTTVAGTVGTAHDGEMLGKKFSSVWVPIRTAIGTAVVIPMGTSGYCVMQMFVMWVIFQGIGLANATWTSFMGSFQYSSFSIKTKLPQVNELTANVFKSLVCVKALDKVSKDPNNQPIFSGLGAKPDWKMATNGGGTSYNFGNQGSILTAGGASLCGSVNIPQPEVTYGPTVGSGEFANVGEAVKGEYTDSIKKAQGKALDALIASLDAPAQSLVDGNAVDPATIDNAIQQYQATVKAAADGVGTAADSFSKLKASAASEGWFLAGAWYMKIVNTIDKTNRAIADVPNSSSTNSINTAIYGDQVNPILAKTSVILSSTKESAKSAIATANTADDSSSAEGLAGKFLSTVGSAVTSVNINDLKNDPRHPMVILKDMGDRMVVAAVTLQVTSAVLAAGTSGVAGGWTDKLLSNIVTLGTFDASSAINTIVIVLTPILFVLGSMLLGTGFMLSYYLPMVPFMIWLGCIVGWLILVVEAIIAAPLWAVMHLHPNGDDLTGRGGSGYMLILSLVLRPMLMILGLSASMILFQVMGEFLNSVFLDVFAMSQGGNIGWAFGTIFAYIIYTGMMVTFAHTMFSIIHKIPDQLMNWIGGGGPSLGEYAGKMEGGVSQKFQGAAGAIGSLSSQISPSSIQSNLRQAKDLSLQKRNNTLQEERADNDLNKTHGAGSSENKNKALDAMGVGGAGSPQRNLASSNFDKNMQEMSNLSKDAPLEYATRMGESAESGFAGHKDAEAASNSIKNDLINENFGSQGMNLAEKIAGDPKNMSNALISLGQSKNSLTSEGFKSMVSSVTATGNNNGGKTADFRNAFREERSNGFANHEQKVDPMVALGNKIENAISNSNNTKVSTPTEPTEPTEPVNDNNEPINKKS